MSRYSHTQQTPGQPTFEGDSEFIGMDMEAAAWLLPPGMVALAQNARCAQGHYGKRGGSIKPLWANVNGFPGGIIGAAIFNNPNGDTKLILIATPATVWKIASGGYPTEVGIPAGQTLSGPVEFTQHFDKVTLHQGDRGPTLEWDGNPANTFVVMTKRHPEVTTTELAPRVDWSVDFSGRGLFPVGRDRFKVGDYEDHTSVELTTRNFRANAGTADTLTGLFPYLGANLIIGKRSSIDVFKNFRGADLTETRAEVVNSTIGIIARKTFQMHGKEATDALFMSRRGFFKLSEVDEDRVGAAPIPVGAYRTDKGRVVDPIAPLLRRIHWEYAHLAVSGIDGPYYVVAFPIDGSTTNNCLAWLNTISNRWEGFDLFAAAGQMQIDELLPFEYNGELRLFAVNKKTSTIHLLNEGKEDELAGGRYEIDMEIITRGYATLGWNATVKRDFKRVVIPVRTWRPSIELEEITEGAHDNRLLTRTPITKDRTKFFAFGKGRYDSTNVNDDALEPGREDYSVVLEGSAGVHLGSGVDPEQKQESVLGAPGGFSTKCRGRFLQYRLRCTQGDCDVLGVLVESDGVQRESRRAA